MFATHHSPVFIKLRDPHAVIATPQYPLSMEGRLGLKSIVDRLLKAHLLIPTCSLHNTPIPAVRKLTGSFHLVKDHCNIDEAVSPTHPVVSDPYTLLSQLLPDTSISCS